MAVKVEKQYRTRKARNNPVTEPTQASEAVAQSECGRISVPEIAQRLKIGRMAVYSMLEQSLMPGLRVGRRWVITRRAYLNWEETCGVRSDPGAAPPSGTGVAND